MDKDTIATISKTFSNAKEVIPFLTKSFPTIQLKGGKECHVKNSKFKKMERKTNKNRHQQKNLTDY